MVITKTVLILLLMGSAMNGYAHGAKLKIKQDAVYVVNGGSGSISIIDAQTDSVVATIDLADDGIDWPHHIAQSADGLTLAVGVPGMDFSHGHSHSGMMTMEGKIVLINSKTGKIKQIITTPSMVHNASISADGSEIWTGYMSENKVAIYDAENGKRKALITVDATPMDVQFSTKGNEVYVAAQGANMIDVIDAKTRIITRRIPVGKGPIAPWVANNGFVYVTSEEEPSFTVIDQSTNIAAPIVALKNHPGSATAYFGDAKHTAWVTDEVNGSVHLFENGDHEVAEIVTGAGAHAITFNGDGTKVYVTNQTANTVSVIDAKSRKVIKTISVGSKPNGILFRKAL